MRKTYDLRMWQFENSKMEGCQPAGFHFQIFKFSNFQI